MVFLIEHLVVGMLQLQCQSSQVYVATRLECHCISYIQLDLNSKVDFK